MNRIWNFRDLIDQNKQHYNEASVRHDNKQKQISSRKALDLELDFDSLFMSP